MDDQGWPDGMEMIRQLREALGLFAGAMPISPQRAWEEALAEARRLRGDLYQRVTLTVEPVDWLLLASERQRAFVGWRVARDDEQVTAWRNESPGYLRFCLGQLEDVDEVTLGALVAKPMTDAEYEAARGQVIEDVMVEYWQELDRNLARLFGPLPPVEDD